MSEFDYVRELGKEKYRAFLDAGYQEYEVPEEDRKWLLQKAIVEKGKILFHINISVVDFSGYHFCPFKVMFGASANFNNLSKNEPCFWVELLNTSSVEEIEAFFLRVYQQMGCEPYG